MKRLLLIFAMLVFVGSIGSLPSVSEAVTQGINQGKIFDVNDYPDINAAIEAASSSGGGVVYLNEGTYKRSELGKAIIMKSGVALVGQGKGTVLYNDGDESTERMILVQGSKGEGVPVQADIKAGAMAGEPVYAVKVKTDKFAVGQMIEMSDSGHAEFNEVIKMDKGYIYLKSRPSYPCMVKSKCEIAPLSLIEDVEIRGIKFEAQNNSGTSVYIDLANNIKVIDNEITASPKAHDIAIQNAELVQITNNKIIGGRHAVSIYKTARKNQISNNVITQSWTGVGLYGHKNTIQNNIIIGSGAGNTSGDGINIGEDASDNIIGKNTIDSGECYGIWVSGENPKNNVIDSNLIRSSRTTGVYVNKGEGTILSNNIISGNSHGILVSGAKNTIINGNNLYENYGKGIFVLYNDTSNTVITDNLIKDNVDGAMDLTDSLKNYVSGNIISGEFKKGTDSGNIIKENLTD